MSVRHLMIAVIIAAFPAPASAQAPLPQTTGDWDLVVDPSIRSTLAYSDFTVGLGIGVRCIDGGYDAVIAGLPDVGIADVRPLTIQFGEEPAAETQWNVATDAGVVVSERPASFARSLRAGGRLQIVAHGAAEGGRNLRYVIDLPASSDAIDRTLAACSKPLVDPRDAELEALGDTGLPGGIGWATPPQPRYPYPVLYRRGFAVVTCLTQPDGGLRACEVETEHPRDGGFGAATLRATRRARLANTREAGAPVPPRRIVFRAQYGFRENGEGLGNPGRLPRIDPPSLNRPR